jgi:multiple sugar transport system permease protein
MAWDSRAKRLVLIYLPLACFVFILLFPFYWMTVTSFKPNAELYDYKTYNPFWIAQPTLDHVRKLLFHTAYPTWLLTTMSVPLPPPSFPCFAACWPLTPFNGFASRAASMWACHLPGLPGAAVDPVIPLATMVFRLGLFDTPLALILVYPTFLVPFCTWLLIGYFKSIPYELEECALSMGRRGCRSCARSRFRSPSPA